MLAYGLPSVPMAALLLPLYVVLPAFYAQDLGVGFTAVGAVLLAARIWDLATDPLIGGLSDRWRSRHGRRRPWLVAGVPLVLVSAYLLFVPPQGIDWPWLLAWTLLLYLGGTMIQLPHAAWGAELSPDYQERSRITAWREALTVVGTLMVAGVPALLGNDRAASLEVIAWGLCFVLPVSVFVAVKAVPEIGPATRTASVWRLRIGLLKSNGPFLRLIVAYFLNGIANGLPATLFLLYVEHVLEASAWSGPLLFIYFLCGIAAIPLWLRLSARHGKHRVWMAVMALSALVFTLVPLLGPGDAPWFLVICVITGMGLGADLTLPPSMQADVIDLDTLKGRQRRGGLFFALWGVATKLSLALGVGIAFPLLDLVGFSGGGDNTAVALFTLAALYSLVPAVFKLASIGVFFRYPITAQRQGRIRRLIEAREGR